jgi:DNA-binding transcriptional MerR regulator
MDPLTGAFTFATIIGLIGQFRSEKGSTAQADFNEFLAWLIETQHEEIKELIESSSQTASGITALLNEQYEALTQKIERLDKTLSTYASGLPGFSEISSGLRPHSVLSDQAVNILKQFERAGASEALKINVYGGPIIMFLDASGNIEIDDLRFLKDDLETLIELELLRHDFNSKGEDLYIYTRAASELVKSLEE